jgi:carbohydrate kinase (thermoresistant glucokinase family)
VILIVFGVSGAGKTTIGKLLAERLGWRCYEADDFHSPTNIEKMHSGIPLTDEDRRSWLGSLREVIKEHVAAGENAVLACSALKRRYRQRLRVNEGVKFVFLRGDYAFVEKQLCSRRGHFMNPALLRSQFANLEEPASDENVLTIQLGRSPNDLVNEITGKLGLNVEN